MRGPWHISGCLTSTPLTSPSLCDIDIVAAAICLLILDIITPRVWKFRCTPRSGILVLSSGEALQKLKLSISDKVVGKNRYLSWQQRSFRLFHVDML